MYKECELSFSEIQKLIKDGKTVEIETPDGFKLINESYIKYGKGVEITFNDKSNIKCANGHLMLTSEGWEQANKIKVNSVLVDFDNNKIKKVISKTEVPEQEWFDFNLDYEKECYYQNGIIHHNSGKSYIQFLIAMMNLKLYSDSKVLVIVPTVGLVEQMKGDFLDYSSNIDPPSIGTIYSGKEKVNYSDIIISTWQSLNVIQDKEFFESFTTVIVDEVHSASNAKVIQGVIQNCTNAKMKVGVSGTIQDEQISQIQLEGLFGRTHNFVNTKELMDNGTLSMLRIEFMVLKYKEEYRKNCYKLPYHDEMQFLRTNPERLNFITNLTKKINKNVLILFKNRDYGEALYSKLISMNLDRNINLVYGSTKAEIREQVRKLAIDDTNGIIVASVGVFATGVNIPSLEYVIFGQTQKSKIKVLQSIGRVLRKSENKSKAVLIDIVDDLIWRRKQNYSMKHGMDRMSIYDSENFDYNIREVEL